MSAEPRELSVEPGQYLRFKIDIVSDYCATADAVARNLCMSTPQARVTVKACRGEAWLLTNPTKTWEPTIASNEFISRHGNSTNFIEVSEFSVTLAETHIAVYNPGLNYAASAIFQIWAINTLD